MIHNVPGNTATTKEAAAGTRDPSVDPYRQHNIRYHGANKWDNIIPWPWGCGG